MASTTDESNEVGTLAIRHTSTPRDRRTPPPESTHTHDDATRPILQRRRGRFPPSRGGGAAFRVVGSNGGGSLGLGFRAAGHPVARLCLAALYCIVLHNTSQEALPEWGVVVFLIDGVLPPE